MPWLVVLGEGAWLAGPRQRYEPGKHEIDDALAERVRSSEIRRLLVLDVEPDILWHHEDDGPLTLEHVRRGMPNGAYLPTEAEPEPTVEPERGRLQELPCLYCPLIFPSEGALKRHVEFHHS